MAKQENAREPQADETTGVGNPELVGQPPHPTPGQAEGDLATVEEDLRQKESQQSDAQQQNDRQKSGQKGGQKNGARQQGGGRNNA